MKNECRAGRDGGKSSPLLGAIGSAREKLATERQTRARGVHTFEEKTYKGSLLNAYAKGKRRQGGAC